MDIMPGEQSIFRAVGPLLQPRTMAIVGASESGGSGWSKGIFHNLKAAGFPVKPYLINPTAGAHVQSASKRPGARPGRVPLGRGMPSGLPLPSR